MTEETIAWLQGANGRSLLMIIHIAGMMLAACAAAIGYGIGVRLLYRPGPRPGRVLTRLIHGGVVVGIVLLWLSGGGLAAGSIVADERPAQMAFKLGVVAILSMSVWAEQVIVLPLMYSRRRPLAAGLGWGELIGAIVVVSVSVSCWMMLVANSVGQSLQAIAHDRLFGFLGGAVGLLSIVGFLLAVVVRMRTPKARPASVKKAPRGRRKRLQAAPPPTLAQVNGGAGRTPDVRPLPSPVQASPPRVVAPQPVQALLGYRLRQSNVSEQQHLRDKLAQEWSRCTQARAARRKWTEGQAQVQADERLVHDWLRRLG